MTTKRSRSRTGSGSGRAGSAFLTALAAILMIWPAACRDSGPLEPLPDAVPDLTSEEGPVVVSEPGWLVVTARTGEQAPQQVVGAASSGSTADDLVSYVSFPPETYPEADSTRIVNTNNGFAVTGLVVDGGLDPVAVEAEVGDVLEITVLAKMTAIGTILRTVPERRPPVIVRTRPTDGRRSVPLNSIVTLVFTEPIDPTTITDETIILRDAEDEVEIRLVQSDFGVKVDVIPLVPLAPLTEFTVTVDGITDLAGEPLETPFLLSFGTEAEPPSPSLVLLSAVSAVPLGVTVQLSAQVVNPPEGESSTIIWTSSQPGVAFVDSAGRLMALQEGVTEVTAAAAGLRETVAVRVTERTPASLQTISSGEKHTCALSPAGKVWCWGSNSDGQLGTDAVPAGSANSIPVPVSTEESFVSLSSGAVHTCGLMASGEVSCWGRNDSGQLGDGTNERRLTPVSVASPVVFTSLSAGEEHTCGIGAGATAYCWGRNDAGQLGDGTSIDRASPVEVAGGHAAVSLTAGSRHSCLVAEEGRPYCWGSNQEGQLGVPPTELDQSLQPVMGVYSDPPFDFRWSVLSAGDSHTCGIREDDGYGWWLCWGTPISGLLGQPTKCYRNLEDGAGYREVDCDSHPWTVGGFADPPFTPEVASVTDGANFGCGLTPESAAYCFGSGHFGQRGDGRTGGTLEARAVDGPRFDSLSSGEDHTCGITEGGQPYCWGRNDQGQVGDGSTIDRLRPVEVLMSP